jgi:hypothetical protein
MEDHIVMLGDAEIDTLIEAILDAQAELCVGDGFLEATAYDERLERLLHRFASETGRDVWKPRATRY